MGTGYTRHASCRFCLNTAHRQEQCRVVSDTALRENRLEAREAHCQKLRIRQGLRPGSPFNGQPPPAWQKAAPQGPARVNVFEGLPSSDDEGDPVAFTKDELEDLQLTGEAGEDA